jgi:F0F1-type ATP synthase membrane subunit b/b'
MTRHDDHETFVEGETAGVPAILDALTDAIERARAMPMSSSVLVNRNETLDLIDELREALPSQLTRADEVLSDADQVLADAHAEAEDLITTARARAVELVSAEQIVLQGQVHARELIAQAEQTAAALRRDADDYCDRRLAEFEIDLGKVLAQVHAGRDRLAERLAEEPMDEPFE